MDQQRIGQGLILAALLVNMTGFIYAIPVHLTDSTWTDHAQVHTFQAMIWVAGLSLIGIVVNLIRPTPNTNGTTLALGLIGMTIWGGYFAGVLWHPDGAAPGLLDDLLFITLSAAFAIGLWLSHKS